MKEEVCSPESPKSKMGMEHFIYSTCLCGYLSLPIRIRLDETPLSSPERFSLIHAQKGNKI